MTIVAEEPNNPGFNFVAAGDWGCGNEAIQTFSMMRSMEPELYLGLGDYSYENSMDCWYDIVESAGKAFKISLGNHDTEGKLLQSYMDRFGIKSQYYSFDYLNAHFIALSTELSKQESTKQLLFTRNDLLKTKANQNTDWIFVFFHKPFYPDNPDPDIINMRKEYHPLFEKFGVDLVIQGHLHNYQRSYPLLFNDDRPSRPVISNKEQYWYKDPQGPIFVIAGTGGESIQSLHKESFQASSYEGYGCINVEIKGKSMSVEYYTDTNDTIDRFLITKMTDKSDRTAEKSEVQKIQYDDSTK